MPKSKHSRGKRPQYKNRPRAAAPASAGTAAPAAAGTVSPAVASAPAAPNRSAAPAKPVKGSTAKVVAYAAATKEQYPFFTGELMRIGLLTVGAVIVLLVCWFIFK
jgi:hypothetical protein